MNKDFQVKSVTDSEFKIAIKWATNEGWNPGLNDLRTFYRTDPTGFFIGYLDDQPISCISAVAYNDYFGFIGFYIVKPEFRGQGYGLSTWEAALKHLPTQNIGLDGVVDQQENYKKSGFTFAYRNIRYQGKSRKFSVSEFKGVNEITEADFEAIISYDSECFPVSRDAFLFNWLNTPQSFSAKLIGKNSLEGFGMIRRCHKGYKIGPLFADNFKAAEKIYKALVSQIPEGEEIYLDIPEPNTEATRLAKRYNLTYCFETARMYTKTQPDININKIFGITTFELG